MERINRGSQRRQVICVCDMGNIPAEPLESLANVFAEGEVGIPFNRDVVVIVDPAKIVELQVAGDACGLTSNPFHQVAIAAERVDVVIEQVVLGGVVIGGEPLLGHRHADRVAEACTEGPGRRFDPRGLTELGMTGTGAADLTKMLQVVEGDRGGTGRVALLVDPLDTRQVKHAVEQHRCVPAGQHETIAGGPMRLRRIVVHRVIEQLIGDRRQSHRRTGMTTVCGLDGIHAEGANGVDGKVFDVGRCNTHQRHYSLRRERKMVRLLSQNRNADRSD